MAYNKVFFHGAGPGIGEMMALVDAAHIPFTIKSIKNEGFVLEGLEYRNAPHQIIYRDPGPGGAGDDHPDLGLSPAEAAGEHWARLELSLPDGIKKHRQRIWIEPVNEIDTNAHAEWLGEFSKEYALLALQNGYRILMSGHNAGQPEPEHWELYFRQYLELCGEYPDRLGVSLHEAKLGDMTIPAWDDTWVPYLIGRYKFLHEACDRMGLNRPTVFISEWAWAYNDMPSDEIVRADIDWLSEEIAQHPNIRGICLWNLDPGGGGAAPKLANQIEYVTQLTLNTRWPDPPPIDPGFKLEYEADNLPKHETKTYGLRDLRDITTVAIHHSVTPDTYDWVRKIATYHVNEKGWPGIGYHYCITGDGRIIQTNHEKSVSYHVGDQNDVAIGVALLGNFGAKWPTDIQIEATNWLIDIIKQGLPDVVVLPHRHVPQSRTSCPGATWDEWFNRIVPVEPEPPATLEEFLWQDSIETQCISLNPTAALQSAIFGDGFVPVGTEIWTVYNGDTYAYMAAETLDESLPRRVYYALTPNWHTIMFTEDPSVTPPTLPPVLPKLDMAKYFWPDGDFGPIATLANNWGAGDERQQLQVGADGESYVTKNQQWEKRVFSEDEDGQFIDLVMDTSPGENRYYTFDGHWMPRFWDVGLTHVSAGTTEFFEKGDCSSVVKYTAESMMRFAQHYIRYELGSLVFNNVAVIEWIVGGEVDETYWFAEGVGLIRWLKYNGLESKVVELIPVGQQENNTREIVPCAGV